MNLNKRDGWETALVILAVLQAALLLCPALGVPLHPVLSAAFITLTLLLGVAMIAAMSGAIEVDNKKMRLEASQTARRAIYRHWSSNLRPENFAGYLFMAVACVTASQHMVLLIVMVTITAATYFALDTMVRRAANKLCDLVSPLDATPPVTVSAA